LFLLGTFATAALLMALVGVYGVMAYSVVQRRREIGVRIALGAQRSDVLRLIMAQSMQMTFWGMAAGTGTAWMLTRLLGSLLYEVTPHDGATFGAILMILVATVLLASWVPAFKASRLDPQVALRQE
jgi:putative ABC transport system permease protein